MGKIPKSNGAKKTKKKVPAKSSERANSKTQSVQCELCNKSFSKKANLNDHIAVKHKGRRFLCTICEEDFTTKASYVRHMNRAHPDLPVENVNEKEVYAADKIQMTEAAKDALLDRLSKELVNKNKTISKQKKTIDNLQKKVDKLTQEVRLKTKNDGKKPRSQ